IVIASFFRLRSFENSRVRSRSRLIALVISFSCTKILISAHRASASRGSASGMTGFVGEYHRSEALTGPSRGRLDYGEVHGRKDLATEGEYTLLEKAQERERVGDHHAAIFEITCGAEPPREVCL